MGRSETTVRAQLNLFFSDVYKVLDPLSDSDSLHGNRKDEEWKTEWKRIKQQGFAPDCNLTRYKFSFFLFGRDRPNKNYKADRSVKNIIETFCNRFPVQEHFAIHWSTTDPDMFMHNLVDADEDEESDGTGNLITQPDNSIDGTWSTVPGSFDPEKHQSPNRKVRTDEPTYSPKSNRYGELPVDDVELPVKSQSPIESSKSSEENLSYSITSHDINLGPTFQPKETDLTIPVVTRSTDNAQPRNDKIHEEIKNAIRTGTVNDIDAQTLAEWIVASTDDLIKVKSDNLVEIKSAVNSNLSVMTQHKQSLSVEMDKDISGIRKQTVQAKIDCENMHDSYKNKVMKLESIITDSEASAISSINSVSNASIDTIKSLHRESKRIINDLRDARAVSTEISKSVNDNIDKLQDENQKYIEVIMEETDDFKEHFKH